jgi:hypothetical protein
MAFHKKMTKKDWEYRDFLYHWIRNLVSKETIQNYNFMEWMGEFKDRYHSSNLKTMKFAWDFRKKRAI